MFIPCSFPYCVRSFEISIIFWRLTYLFKVPFASKIRIIFEQEKFPVNSWALLMIKQQSNNIKIHRFLQKSIQKLSLSHRIFDVQFNALRMIQHCLYHFWSAIFAGIHKCTQSIFIFDDTIEIFITQHEAKHFILSVLDFDWFQLFFVAKTERIVWSSICFIKYEYFSIFWKKLRKTSLKLRLKPRPRVFTPIGIIPLTILIIEFWT